MDISSPSTGTGSARGPGTVRRMLQVPFLKADVVFDHVFTPRLNPMRQLGTLAFYMFWVCAVSGIYVYIFFETTVSGAFTSVEAITYDGWYHAGVMRSLHRYSSDAMVLAGVVHLVREFIFDRYRGVRWFAWFTGVPILWFLYFSGVSGYWLVWDQMAQYVAVTSMEWLDWLGIFGQSIANNFLTRGSLTDRFFSLLVFIHIFVPLILLCIMWVHVIRLSQPKINPPRGLALGSLLMLLALSLVYPALSQGQADLGIVPQSVSFDWYYLVFYPLYEQLGAGPTWGVAVVITVLVGSLPWLPPLRKAAAASVTLDKCNGCGRCYEDCPYSAIAMVPRTDGAPFDVEAAVDGDLCSRCGICVGSCPVSTPFRYDDALITGIDLPDFTLKSLRERAIAAREAVEKSDAARVVVIGCADGADLKALETDGVAAMTLPCTGMLPPSFVDFLLSRGGVDGVLLTGCGDGGCRHRFGTDWTEERLLRLRDPGLRERVAKDRVRVNWAEQTEAGGLRAAIEEMRRELAIEPTTATGGVDD